MQDLKQSTLIYQFVKIVFIRSFSGPSFTALGLNTEIYRLNIRIQSECGKIQNRKTQTTDTFQAVYLTVSREYFYVSEVKSVIKNSTVTLSRNKEN